jgi:hypothetical protein
MNSGNFTIHHPPTSTRIPLNSRPSTIDLICSNGLHAVWWLLSLQTIFLFFSRSRWGYFFWRVVEPFSPDSWRELEFELELDVMVNTITSVIVEARSRSVPVVGPTWFAVTLTPHIKSIIRLKNSQRYRAQRAWLTQNSGAVKRAKAIFNMLNRRVQFLISKLNNDSFQNKIGTLRPSHKSFLNCTKLIKNKFRCVPALKVGESTLISDAEKTAAIADRFSESHENSQISPITNKFRSSCSVLQGGGFNTDTSTFTSPREIGNVVRGLRNGKAPGEDAINNSLLKNLSRKDLVFLTYLFNGCLKLSYFPTKWKHA